MSRPLAPDGVTVDGRVAWKPSVAWAELDGRAVLYDERANQAHALNGSATAIWARLDGATTLGEVAQDLAAAFDVTVDEVVGDVLALVDALAVHSLVDVGAPTEPSVASRKVE